MDFQSLMNEMLKTGKEMAQKGQSMAEEKLGVPGEGEQRDTMMKGAAIGAGAAGVLALLLGTGAGRSVAGTAVKLGSLAAVGGLAYQMYNKWQAGDFNNDGAEPAQLTDQTPKLSADALLKAMIAAAKADGHIDDDEQALIREKLADFDLDVDVNELILQEVMNPLSVDDVAALAGDDKAAAIEIYLVSSMMVDGTKTAEVNYLKDLQTALGLPDEVVATA